jgi:SAM-dependent methyltransferase
MTDSGAVDARTLWATGDFARVARETTGDLGVSLVEACGIGPGMRVLDVAAGAGNVAIPAALTGADVVASDITPELLEAGREEAERRGARLAWVEADAQALPFEDGAFDVVTSCMGVMFAPDHDRAAAELVRVCRPGGTIGLITADPAGWVARLFLTVMPYGPPPPPGFRPPGLWGVEDHVRGLLGEGARVETFEPRRLVAGDFGSPQGLVDFYRELFGPVIVTREHLAGDPERLAALDRDLLRWATEMNEGRPEGEAVLLFDHVLVLARRAG